MDFAGADRRLHGQDATDWSTRMVQEVANLRAALEWCVSGSDLELGVELAGALRWDCDELGDRWGRAWVLTFWAVAARHSGDSALARAQLGEALSIFRALHDDHNQVIPLTQLALVASMQGSWTRPPATARTPSCWPAGWETASSPTARCASLAASIWPRADGRK
ncbi:MAG: hypothetical protein M3Y04_02600, partial [Actinomycetota bacterium]|nr:hypothetical protein [Actinomycetota bacterium]